MPQTPPRRIAVVLGAAPYGDGTISPALVRRAEAAGALWRQGAVDAVLLAGGYTAPAQPSEAEEMAAVLIRQGVPESALYLEAESLTTRQNARFSLRMMPRLVPFGEGAVDLTIVTDLWHLPRAWMLFAVLSRRMGHRVRLHGHAVWSRDPGWRWYAFQPAREAVAFVADTVRVWWA